MTPKSMVGVITAVLLGGIGLEPSTVHARKAALSACLGLTLSGRIRFAAAALFFIAGHVALKLDYGHW